MFDWNARILAVRLGLGDLERAEACHGYQFCCDCSGCADRAERMLLLADRPGAAVLAKADSEEFVAGRRVLLPWELDAAA